MQSTILYNSSISSKNINIALGVSERMSSGETHFSVNEEDNADCFPQRE